MMFGKELELSDAGSLKPNELMILTFLLKYPNLNTRATYGAILKQLYIWCWENELDMLHLSRVHAQVYLEHLRIGKKQKNSTVTGTYGVLKTFYSYLELEEMIPKNPWYHVKPPVVHDHTIKRPHLNRTQFNDLLQYSHTQSPKYAMMIMLLGIMGLRASELCSLDVKSVSEFEDGFRIIAFTGKGNKPARLPMPMMVMRQTERYLEWTGHTSGPFIQARTGSRYDRGAVYSLVCGMQKRAGVPVVGAHALRRSMVTNSVNAGADIREVQKAARHTDIRTTTRVYDRGTPAHDSSSFHVLAGFIAGAI